MILRVYFISTVFTFIECFVVRGVYTKFSGSGYRAASIFNSPNAYGCILVMMTCLILYKSGDEAGLFLKIFIGFSTLLQSYLSGSRSALLIFLISVLIMLAQRFSLIKKVKKNNSLQWILGISIVLGVAALLLTQTSLINFRNVWQYNISRLFSLRQDLRSVYNYRFFDALGRNFLFPWYHGTEYVDNMYLFVWGRYGFFVFVLYAAFLIWIILKAFKLGKARDVCILICFVIYGFVLNYMYLWPAAYVFWYIVADVLSTKSENRLNLG